MSISNSVDTLLLIIVHIVGQKLLTVWSSIYHFQIMFVKSTSFDLYFCNLRKTDRGKEAEKENVFN